MNKISIYKFVQGVTPPFIFNIFVKSPLYETVKKYINKYASEPYSPSWNKIVTGPLKGKDIFVDANGPWQKKMLGGTYDDFFFEYTKDLNLTDKVVFDVGAHIGFSSLYFAHRVGPLGKVYTFEPNPWNIERIETILTKNEDLKKIITIIPKAISDKEGETDFVFTDNVDGGTSSGSFINEASTLYEKSNYERNGGFKRMKVPTVTIDSYRSASPYLIKIDIEGGESLALQGAGETITAHYPILLIEIHSIYNMYVCMDILRKWNYQMKLLKTEDDGRCFISAIHDPKN